MSNPTSLCNSHDLGRDGLQNPTRKLSEQLVTEEWIKSQQSQTYLPDDGASVRSHVTSVSNIPDRSNHSDTSRNYRSSCHSRDSNLQPDTLFRHHRATNKSRFELDQRSEPSRRLPVSEPGCRDLSFDGTKDANTLGEPRVCGEQVAIDNKLSEHLKYSTLSNKPPERQHTNYLKATSECSNPSRLLEQSCDPNTMEIFSESKECAVYPVQGYPGTSRTQQKFNQFYGLASNVNVHGKVPSESYSYAERTNAESMHCMGSHTHSFNSGNTRGFRYTTEVSKHSCCTHSEYSKTSSLQKQATRIEEALLRQQLAEEHDELLALQRKEEDRIAQRNSQKKLGRFKEQKKIDRLDFNMKLNYGKIITV